MDIIALSSTQPREAAMSVETVVSNISSEKFIDCNLIRGFEIDY